MVLVKAYSQSFTVVSRFFKAQALDGLRAELLARGIEMVDAPDATDLPFVEFFNAEAAEFSWEAATTSAVSSRIGIVVESDVYTLAFLRVALRHGASVVHSSSRPQAAADVLVARSNGELLIPVGVASALVEEREQMSLLPSEAAVLELWTEKRTVAAVANASHYSERHVRRIVQSLQLKAGSSDMEEVVRRLHSAS